MMIAGKEKDLVPSPSDNHVEMIEHVAIEDAEVGCRRVGEGRYFTANPTKIVPHPLRLQFR
jgi:hypothetical protein